MAECSPKTVKTRKNPRRLGIHFCATKTEEPPATTALGNRARRASNWGRLRCSDHGNLATIVTLGCNGARTGCRLPSRLLNVCIVGNLSLMLLQRVSLIIAIVSPGFVLLTIANVLMYVTDPFDAMLSRQVERHSAVRGREHLHLRPSCHPVWESQTEPQAVRRQPTLAIRNPSRCPAAAPFSP